MILDRIAPHTEQFHHDKLVVDGIHLDLHFELKLLEFDLELRVKVPKCTRRTADSSTG